MSITTINLNNQKPIMNVLMVGVIRPNIEQIKSNIEKNITFFSSNYNEYEIIYNIVAYKNKYSDSLCIFLDNLNKENNIRYKIINSIEIPETLNLDIANLQRIMISISESIKMIQENECIVIRLRIDTEVKKLEIKSNINENDIFATYVNNSLSQITDNIGYTNLTNAKKIYDINNFNIIDINDMINIENYFFLLATHYNLVIKNFDFNIILYQSNEEFYDGVKQWSRGNRIFYSEKSIHSFHKSL
tara:strand:+ start:739 stop:1476 length:738 start_codon:yes stop_codon:yes gene_type:complete